MSLAQLNTVIVFYIGSTIKLPQFIGFSKDSSFTFQCTFGPVKRPL